MAYVPQYSNDIFLSYAHVDDEPFVGTSHGWVTTFAGCLKTRLAQLLGRRDSFSFWMDHELRGSEPLTPQILDNVRNSATQVLVLSPSYLASPWCERERDTFLGIVRERGNRVFVVERDVIEEEERPTELRDLRGFRFWVQDREGKPPRILGTPEPSAADLEYYRQIDDLSQEIASELRRLKAEARAPYPGAAPAPASADGPTVYLAQVTDDLDLTRSNVRRYLDQAGARVVPDAIYSQDPAAFGEAAERDLESAQLFVQLLSPVAGKKPPDLPQGYLQFQVELARAAGKRILQWRSPSVEVGSIEDEAHRALLEGPEVRAEMLEDFKRHCRERLREAEAPKADAGGGTAFVFVDMDSADRPLAERLCELLDEHGIAYALPLETVDPGEFRKDLEQNLTTCDGLIVIYGETTATWVRAQLRECQKAVALRGNGFPALAVFEGPPEQKDKLGMKLPEMRVVNCRNGLGEPEVGEFLGSLSSARRP